MRLRACRNRFVDFVYRTPREPQKPEAGHVVVGYRVVHPQVPQSEALLPVNMMCCSWSLTMYQLQFREAPIGVQEGCHCNCNLKSQGWIAVGMLIVFVSTARPSIRPSCTLAMRAVELVTCHSVLCIHDLVASLHRKVAYVQQSHLLLQAPCLACIPCCMPDCEETYQVRCQSAPMLSYSSFKII